MASSNYDVLAGMQDILGYQGLVGDNPYLAYQGAIPFGQNYQTVNPFSGAVQGPTDAYGNPIQPPQGTTLNSNPAQQAAAPAAAPAPAQNPNQNYVNQLLTNSAVNALPSRGDGTFGNPVTGIANNQNAVELLNLRQQQNAAAAQQAAQTMASLGPNPSALAVLQQFGLGGGQPSAAGSAGSGTAGNGGGGSAAPAGGGPLTNQQYLSLLANPGPLKPVGAAPPGPGQAPTGPSNTGGNVMSAFLANNRSGNTPFLNTLRTMQDQAAGGVA